MQSNSENTEKRSYVEIRDEKRRDEIQAISDKMVRGKGEGWFQDIADLARVDIHTVYKALNPNQGYYNDKIIKVAKEYIKNKYEQMGLKVEQL